MTAREIIDELDNPFGVSFERWEELLAAGERLPDFGTPIFDLTVCENMGEGDIFFLYERDADDLRQQYGL